MTFEYRDPDYDLLRVEPAPHHSDGPRIILHAEFTHDLGTDMAEVAVPLDRVEEVIAGIRDAARTASGQQPKPASLATPCSYCSHTLNWHVTGGRCRVTAGENGCGCSAFVAPDGSHPDNPATAPAVGQPAEAQAVCGDPTGCHRVVPCARPCGTDLLAEVDKQVRESNARDRAAVLREAADRAEQLGLHLSDKGENIRSSGAYEVMTELRRMAEEARS